MQRKSPICNEKGFILIGTLLVLVAVTAIGLTLMNVATTEIDISTGEKCKEEARYNSESCTMAGAKLIRMVLDEAANEGMLGIPEGDPRIRGISYADEGSANKGADFAAKLFDVRTPDMTCEDFSLTPVGKNMDAGANLRSMGAAAPIGSAANRQISGYSYGVGLGGAAGGGFVGWYVLSCRGGGCNGEGRHISYSRYKRAPIAGGL